MNCSHFLITSENSRVLIKGNVEWAAELGWLAEMGGNLTKFVIFLQNFSIILQVLNFLLSIPYYTKFMIYIN